MPKLTLQLDQKTIDNANRIAEQRGVSVSTLFADFIQQREPQRRMSPTAPITRRTRGLAKVSPDKRDRELFEGSLPD